MSYSLTLRGGRLTLGADTTFSFAAKLATDYSGSKATAAAKSGSVPSAPDVLPDCTDAALTDNDYIDKTIVKCCEEVKKNWGLSFEDQAKGIVQCAVRGGATATCMAAGVITFGITTLAAPLCGEIGSWCAERVLGYSGVQLGASLVGAALCSVGGPAAVVCAVALAELVGWLSDGVGPIIEGIFDPGAAKRRELAARAAYHKAIEANNESCAEADEKYRLAWGLGVGSIKELYSRAFPTAALQAQAKKQLGFGPTYGEIAAAMGIHGAAAEQISMNKGTRGCYGAHPDWECPGCEQFEYVQSARHADPQWKGTPWEGITSAWLVEGKKEPWSDVCPFSIQRFYNVEREKALGKSPKRDQVTAWEKKFAPTIARLAAQIYPAMVKAIADLVAKITGVAVSMKLDELTKAAQSASREQLAVRVAMAASRAEAAADVAKHGSAKEAKAAVLRASQQYEIAAAAYEKLYREFGTSASASYLTTGSKPSGAAAASAAASQALACNQDPHCRRAGASLARAKAAKDNAPVFAARAARNRLLLGAAVGAGAIGAAYYFTR